MGKSIISLGVNVCLLHPLWAGHDRRLISHSRGAVFGEIQAAYRCQQILTQKAGWIIVVNNGY